MQKVKNPNGKSKSLQSALEKLTLEETVALTTEFERILAIGVCDPARKQDAKGKRKREPTDRNGDALRLGQKVETTANGRRVTGRVKRLGKRVSIEVKNRPIIVRAFHNVQIVQEDK